MRIYMFVGILFVSPLINAAAIDTPQNCGIGYLNPCVTEEIQQERFWSAFGTILAVIFLVAILLRGLKNITNGYVKILPILSLHLLFWVFFHLFATPLPLP